MLHSPPAFRVRSEQRICRGCREGISGAARSPASEAAEKPDIYYFIFNRYAHADFMKWIYGHDNEPFLEELRKRGFYVAEKSFANYQRTAHSMVS